MNIPKTIKSAEAKLTKLDGIVSASQWERAAIVYAFTQEGEVGGDPTTAAKVRSDLGVMSFREFAALGIVGLKSKNTVLKYHEAWQSAIDDGEALPIAPGDAFNEPELDWPPEGRGPKRSGATNPRVVERLSDDEDMKEIVAAMPVIDLIPLINAAQKKVNASQPSRPVSEAGPLDVMVSMTDMGDALYRLEKAEPEWSSAVKEGHINKDVYDEHFSRMNIVHTLMKMAGESEAFEMGVPRP